MVGHLGRQVGLAQLPGDGLLVGQVDVSHQLLLDRRGALHDPARGDVLVRGAQHALVVDAAVLVEALVLDVDRRHLEPGGHLAESHRRTVLDRRDERQQVVVTIEDPRRDTGVVRLQGLQVVALEHVAHVGLVSQEVGHRARVLGVRGHPKMQGP